ncbi:Protein of unknown function [Duganella sp. CF458]|uniref:DUF2867 domain-containing protein n=1 Tax=Duganella sp. CF458 TaxID=1884368 RepID=UPI0008EA8024|nr:DUF2867 domain-containing protein [Duganella sp. CF458]SFG00888.1 Protein of unknown function [Duganella sp. CF458]
MLLSVFSVATVAHVHNWLGRLYMLPVTLLHKIIIKTMLKGTSVRANARARYLFHQTC